MAVPGVRPGVAIVLGLPTGCEWPGLHGGCCLVCPISLERTLCNSALYVPGAAVVPGAWGATSSARAAVSCYSPGRHRAPTNSAWITHTCRRGCLPVCCANWVLPLAAAGCPLLRDHPARSGLVSRRPRRCHADTLRNPVARGLCLRKDQLAARLCRGALCCHACTCFHAVVPPPWRLWS